MELELQSRILRELKRQIDTGRNIDAGVQYKMPTSAYVCPEIAAKEWDVMFQNHPQVIGLSGDLPKPGSFLTINDFGTPVLATRDKDGHFHAFLNACRHRGVQVTQVERGRKNIFTCPFHAWSYANTGKLIAITDEEDFGAFDKSCNGLIELPAVERAGMLWVHPQPDGQLDLDALLGETLLEEIASHNVGELAYGADKTIKMNLNWKLANDTFGETYHFAKLHKNTLAHVFKGNNLHFEEFGRHHRFTTASHGIDALQGKPESEWNFWASTAFMLYYIYPNTTLILNENTTNLLRFYPDPENPGRSITQIAIYGPPDLVAAELADKNKAATETDRKSVYQGEDSDINTIAGNLEVFSSTVEEEDYLMGELQQKSAQNGLLKEIVFGRNEPPLHHFHNSFREALGQPPLEKVES